MIWKTSSDHPSSFLTPATNQTKGLDSNKKRGISRTKSTEADEVGYSSGPAQPQMWLLRLDTRPLLQGGSGFEKRWLIRVFFCCWGDGPISRLFGWGLK